MEEKVKVTGKSQMEKYLHNVSAPASLSLPLSREPAWDGGRQAQRGVAVILNYKAVNQNTDVLRF